MKCRVLVFVFLLVASVASAQTPSSYVLKFYNSGATSAVQTETFASAAVTCNQVAPTGTSTVNPNKVVWTDTANVGKVCIFTESATGPLFSLPIGNYEGTLSASNAAGTSAESARAPFVLMALPAVPAGLQLVR